MIFTFYDNMVTGMVHLSLESSSVYQDQSERCVPNGIILRLNKLHKNPSFALEPTWATQECCKDCKENILKFWVTGRCTLAYNRLPSANIQVKSCVPNEIILRLSGLPKNCSISIKYQIGYLRML